MLLCINAHVAFTDNVNTDDARPNRTSALSLPRTQSLPAQKTAKTVLQTLPVHDISTFEFRVYPAAVPLLLEFPTQQVGQVFRRCPARPYAHVTSHVW